MNSQKIAFIQKNTVLSFVLLLFGIVGSPFFASAQSVQRDTAAIRRVLREQEAAWNRGDIAAFMQGYWQSENLEFIGKNGLKKGWQQTLDNYKTSYPDAATMGTLDFTILSIEVLGKKAAYIVGQWHLTRPDKGDLRGAFTLLWKKINGKWLIVSDHSS